MLFVKPERERPLLSETVTGCSHRIGRNPHLQRDNRRGDRPSSTAELSLFPQNSITRARRMGLEHRQAGHFCDPAKPAQGSKP